MSGLVETLVECPLNINTTYDCANPYPNCTSSLGFQFSSLWIISQNIYNACPTDWRIADPQVDALSDAACQEIAGSGWTYYPGADIWARLTTWKFPLLQLVAIFPRPPLSFRTEAFVLFHLLGNPVGTIKDLILKFATCQSRAEFWEHHLSRELKDLVDEPEPKPRYSNLARKWKALAIITDSYDEWGTDKGDAARDFLFERLNSTDIPDSDKIKLLAICQKTGNALAADRTTKFFPVIVAQGLFIGTVAIAFGRTESAAAGLNPTTFINIEAHSIAFTALYFWVIPAVFLASVIGVSQTENAIPRIVQRFQSDIRNAFPRWTSSLPNDHLTEDDVEGRPDAALRERSGGIYTWQPTQARSTVGVLYPTPHSASIATTPNLFAIISSATIKLFTLRRGSPVFALILVAVGTITGLLISYLVPPVGFEARHIAELLIYETWLLSALLDYLPFGTHHRAQFWLTFGKDLLATVATMGGIIATQVGVFNRCGSYTLWGKVPLQLPEVVSVAGTLVHRIATVYPALAFLAVGLQLVVFPAWIVVQYHQAVRVFLQRDDNASNFAAWHAVCADWARSDGWWLRRGWFWAEASVRRGLGGRVGAKSPIWPRTVSGTDPLLRTHSLSA